MSRNPERQITTREAI
jgi:hypothetical protein